MLNNNILKKPDMAKRKKREEIISHSLFVFIGLEYVSSGLPVLHLCYQL